jgi:hypothetical protein
MSNWTKSMAEPLVALAKCTLAALIAVSFSTAGRLAQASTGNPHYEMVFDGDKTECPRILSLYNQLLHSWLQKGEQKPTHFDGSLNNFATDEATAFQQIGLIPPQFLKEIQPVRFYSVILGPGQQPRVLALRELYWGSSPHTAIAIFKAGVPPRLAAGSNSLGLLPVSREDVDKEISLEALADSQPTLPHPGPIYFLTKWPDFSHLLASHAPFSGFVPFIGGSAGVTISPLQTNDDRLYLIYDQYISLREASEMSRSSGQSGIVLVQRLSSEKLADVCYLVLAPSSLATLGEPRHVR